MVFYFLTEAVSPPMVIYMGVDKHENEELLRWGFPEDVWFHVDKMSSAHVYLRLPKGMMIEDIPQEALIDCAQLVKANSIEGCKANNVTVVYTPFANLKKTAGMEVGQVGFHKQKLVCTILVEKKDNERVKRLNRTKEERHPDLRAEREGRDRKEREEERRRMQEERQQSKEDEERSKKEAELRSYASVMTDDNMKSNKLGASVDYRAVEDDFM